MNTPLPETCGVAFKEWAGVCEALATGRQALILRKGGIEEGPDGFQPEHPNFWLYPTFVHQAEQGLKPEANRAEPAGSSLSVAIQSLAAVELIGYADRLETLAALDSLHVWTEETVEKRFHYKRPGLWVLGVRVYNNPNPLAIPVTPEQLGCKTWVPLDPALSTLDLIPAIAEPDFLETMACLRPLIRRFASR